MISSLISVDFPESKRVSGSRRQSFKGVPGNTLENLMKKSAKICQAQRLSETLLTWVLEAFKNSLVTAIEFEIMLGQQRDVVVVFWA